MRGVFMLSLLLLALTANAAEPVTLCGVTVNDSADKIPVSASYLEGAYIYPCKVHGMQGMASVRLCGSRVETILWSRYYTSESIDHTQEGPLQETLAGAFVITPTPAGQALHDRIALETWLHAKGWKSLSPLTLYALSPTNTPNSGFLYGGALWVIYSDDHGDMWDLSLGWSTGECSWK